MRISKINDAEIGNLHEAWPVKNLSQIRTEIACRFDSDCQIPAVENLEIPVIAQIIVHPEGLTAAIRSANLEPCQLGPSSAPSRLARVSCPTVCLDFLDLGAPMLIRGVMPTDCYTLVFVTKCPIQGRSFNFSTEHLDGYMGFFPPGGELDAFIPAGYANATLTIPAAIFLAAVQRLFPEMPAQVLKRGAGMRIGTDQQARLRTLLAMVKGGIENPTAPLADCSVRKHLEIDLLNAFLNALRCGCGDLVQSPGLRLQGRLRRLQRARDYLADRLHEPISITDVCDELGLSHRGLEMIFKDTLGIGPGAFIRHQRLHGVRRMLRTAPPAAGVVKESARQWGFLHMGHFAREYRQLFGESPSATLSGR